MNTGHILVLRRKTDALSRAKTSALLRPNRFAVLRARTCALFKSQYKGHPRGVAFVVAAEGHPRGGRGQPK